MRRGASLNPARLTPTARLDRALAAKSMELSNLVWATSTLKIQFEDREVMAAMKVAVTVSRSSAHSIRPDVSIMRCRLARRPCLSAGPTQWFAAGEAGRRV